MSHPRAKILVVDDQHANLVAMRRLLADVNADLVEASNGNDALAATLNQEFALILLDVQMPDIDGFEVAELLRGEENTRSVPIIFVTAALTDELHCLRGYQVGAIDYIMKPISEPILLAKVQSFLELYESKRALQQALAELDQRNAQLHVEVAERRRAEADARHKATHDMLTGLPNRLLFMDRVEMAIERARRANSHFVLAYMDLDGFKPVNDEYGHAAGDEVLRVVGARLTENIRASDTVARLGGDEFAALFENMAQPEAALHLAEQLRQRISRPLPLPDLSEPVKVAVNASTGLAIYPQHGDAVDKLLHNADCALYAVKHAGKADARLFQAGDQSA